MRIEIKQTITLPRQKGGTVTYPAGTQHTVSDDDGEMLCGTGSAFVVGAPPPPPEPSFDLSPTLMAPDADDYEEEEE